MMTKRLFQYLAWAAVAVILLVTLSPIGLRPHTMTSVSIDRSVAFAVLGLLFSVAYPRHVLPLALFLVGLAYGIEALQALSPTRHAEFTDATVKACGAIAGFLAGKILIVVWRRLSASRTQVRQSVSGS